KDHALHKQVRKTCRWDYAKMALTTAAALPAWAAVYAALRPGDMAVAACRREFAGVAISPREDDPDGARQRELVAELGVGTVQVRIPVWQRDRFDQLFAFIAACAPLPVQVVVCQDRMSVCDHGQWRADVRAIYAGLPANVRWLQIGNAVNRLKWGCAHIGEYLDLLEIAQQEHRRAGRPLQLLGSSVIDFEPAMTARSLFHVRDVQLDGTAALLYVDRRGAPGNTQYGVFDSARKIRTVAAAAALSPRSANRLWLTEVNWPLRGQGAWAPTSQHEAVDEDAAGRFLAEYYQIAWASQLVERVVAWQLVARGYGLVDPADGAWRPRPAFSALREWVAAG
ncbi:MAG: hypothetical protein ACYTF0_01495, partial [Planctomycetota bacterium]